MLILDGGQIVVIPSCGNMRKVEFLINFPKITDPSKILMYIEVNDIDNQYLKDIVKNFVTIARTFQEELKWNIVHLLDVTPRNDHFQDHVQAVNQSLAYKISSRNFQKVSQNNL